MLIWYALIAVILFQFAVILVVYKHGQNIRKKKQQIKELEDEHTTIRFP